MVHRRVRGGKFKIKHVDEPCPVELGQEIEVTIIDLAPNGDGRLNIRGFDLLVPKAKPRDSVLVRIVTVTEKYAIGNIIS
jgi:predicted RNA-binding protein with TRAM domain